MNPSYYRYKCLFSTLLLIFRKRWGYIFNNDEDVVGLVGDIMPIVALFQVRPPTLDILSDRLRLFNLCYFHF